MWEVPYAITIRNIKVLTVGGFDETDSNGGTVVAVDSDITATAGTRASDDGSLTNPTIAANNNVYWHTTSIFGSPTTIIVTFYDTVDSVN
ncbi:MAG: hypothetical protein IT292_10175 [Deltaproteobacteria bacterium]|nr:hypothetical protein [Deltaproteobacteria bacterium]